MKITADISPDCPAHDPGFIVRLKIVTTPILRAQGPGAYQCAIFDYLGREYAAIMRDGNAVHVQDQTGRWRMVNGGVELT